jgi:hypothetical protein
MRFRIAAVRTIEIAARRSTPNRNSVASAMPVASAASVTGAVR